MLTKSVKTDQSEGIPDPGMPEWPFVKFAHWRSFASSSRAFFIFLRAIFYAAPWLTERLEEVNGHGEIEMIWTNTWCMQIEEKTSHKCGSSAVFNIALEKKGIKRGNKRKLLLQGVLGKKYPVV